MNKYLCVYINHDGKSYTLFGVYALPKFDSKEDLFRTVRSFMPDSLTDKLPKYAHMMYSSEGTPMTVYPAFPVEQLDSEVYGPYSLANLHEHLFGTTYKASEWVEYTEL